MLDLYQYFYPTTIVSAALIIDLIIDYDLYEISLSMINLIKMRNYFMEMFESVTWVASGFVSTLLLLEVCERIGRRRVIHKKRVEEAVISLALPRET
ncbi:MAG: hypothetical protein DLM72_17035 [Candidatus Nitrosopolaris wilkensis]|nr:MAG: hypothetical protein DLM72_17035 [Candidatus Nitrosopolaris wilkensis]